MVAADMPVEERARDQNRRHQRPHRPGRQKYKFAFMKKAGRILEQQLKHEFTCEAESRQVYGRDRECPALQAKPG